MRNSRIKWALNAHCFVCFWLFHSSQKKGKHAADVKRVEVKQDEVKQDEVEEVGDETINESVSGMKPVC